VVEIAGAGEPAELVNEMNKVFKFFKMTGPLVLCCLFPKGSPVSYGRVSRCLAPTPVIAGGAFFLSPMRGVEPLRQRSGGWCSLGSGEQGEGRRSP